MNDVYAYINQFDDTTQQRLRLLQRLITTEAPDAEEGIMYGLIGYKLNKKPLAYFGAFKSHIGLYATPNTHQEFTKELAPYKQGKGSVQFPLNQPLPLDLITRMVRFRRDSIR